MLVYFTKGRLQKKGGNQSAFFLIFKMLLNKRDPVSGLGFHP
jgi:hypothetical protein